LLIFEVTAGRILHLPITNQQSTINNQQSTINNQQSSFINRQFVRGRQKRRNPFGTRWSHRLGHVQKSAVIVPHRHSVPA
jgi:hypothetical protein